MTLATGLRPVRRSDPADTLAKARRLVDERTGIIRAVYENPMEPDGPAMFGYGSVLADTTQFGVPATDSLNGSTSVVREHALAGAVGEAVERYSVRMVPEDRLVTAPMDALAGPWLDPRALVLYSDEQYRRPGFPYPPVREDVPIRWVEGFSLTRSVPVMVPAFAVYIPYVPAPGEPSFVEQTSNGLACGNTLEEAVLSGLLEVVERHAAMSMWLTEKSLPHVDAAATRDPLLRKTLQAFARVRYDVHLLDASAATGIPVVISVALDPAGRGPAATFASAAGVSGRTAAIGALEELGQCYVWLKSLMARRASQPSRPLGELSSVEDHVFWATSPEHLDLVQFTTASRTTRSVDDLPDLSGRDVLDGIERCVGQLAERDLEVLVVDVTSPDVREVGLSVVRVLVPGAQPLFFGAGLDRVSPRLRSARRSNPWPHPFP